MVALYKADCAEARVYAHVGFFFFSGFGEGSVYFWASPCKETQPLSFAYVRYPGMVFRVFEKMGGTDGLH